jgi:hypothetical protein
MPTTPNRDYPYPGVNDAPDGPYAFEQLAAAVDLDVQDIYATRTKRLGSGRPGAPVLLQGDSDWEDLASVSGTTRGQLCSARWDLEYYNGNSGAHRTAVFRVILDGAEVRRWQADAPYRGGEDIHHFAGSEVESSPAAGAHVWKLQGYATHANAVVVPDAVLVVTEWQP